MTKPEILYLITARGGSKRVPGKNLERIGNLSLVGFKAMSAKRSAHCAHLAISTDSPAIADEAATFGVDVPFLRPAHLADDVAQSDDVVLNAMDYFEYERNRRFDAIMLLEPASPFARASDYDAAVDIYLQHQASLVVGMRRMEVSSIYTGPLGADQRANRIIGKFSGRKDLRGQALEPEYTMNGALYLIAWDHMRKTKAIYGDPESSFGYVMDRFHSIEIETPSDLLIARLLVEGGHIELTPWL